MEYFTKFMTEGNFVMFQRTVINKVNYIFIENY